MDLFQALNISDGETLNIPMMTICAINSIIGISLNVLVMVISVTQKDVHGSYQYYMFNLAFVDCIGAAHYGALAICLSIAYYSNSITACALIIFALDWILTATIACMIPMTIHRRLAFDYANRNWFKSVFRKNTMISYCIAVDLLCVVLGVGSFYMDSFSGSLNSADFEFCNSQAMDEKDNKLTPFHLQVCGKTSFS
jgi:hypothetical protein